LIIIKGYHFTRAGFNGYGYLFLEGSIFERRSKPMAPLYAIRLKGPKGLYLSREKTFLCRYLAKNPWLEGRIPFVIGDVAFHGNRLLP